MITKSFFKTKFGSNCVAIYNNNELVELVCSENRFGSSFYFKRTRNDQDSRFFAVEKISNALYVYKLCEIYFEDNCICWNNSYQINKLNLFLDIDD